MPATTRERRLPTGQKAAGRIDTKRPGTGTPAGAPERSQQATLALDALCLLLPFFGHDAHLAQALGWDEATAAQWRDRRVVRPQRIKAMQVLLLYEAAQEARAYLESDTNVGEWLNAPMPNLRGNSPARWIRTRGP